MGVRNFEVFNIILILVVAIDYYSKYKRKLTDNSILFFLYVFFAIALSTINVCIFYSSKQTIDYYLLLLSYTIAIIPLLIYCYYIEINYLHENNKKKLVLTTFIELIIYLIIVYATFRMFGKKEISLNYFTEEAYFSILLIPLSMPSLVMIGKYLFQNKYISNRVFFAMICPLIGIFIDLLLPGELYMTMGLTLSALILYIYKYDAVVNTDALTGAYNRRFLEGLTMAENKLYAMFMIDIDSFKLINDTYGHDMGDVILKDVVSILISSSRATDSVIRTGGDEFLVISCIKKPSDIEIIQNRIDKEVNNYNKKHDIKVSLSIGSDIYNPKKDLSKFLKVIDEKMYEVKKSKKNEKR